ncbi:PKD domain-containing protein [Candidatus Bipolaricaulota bacterium]|nr:PKD domain-containing protein [Candidatus Bipolaricaulota bacterium]
MFRRGLVRLLVFVLAVAILPTLTGCFETFQINGCGGPGDGSDPRAFFGRAPHTQCMEAVGGYGAAVVVTWNFGDGTTATGSQVTHTYTEVGEYLVVAERIAEDGSIDRDDTIVAVAGEPEAAFTNRVYDPSSSGSIFSWLPSWLTGANGEDSDMDIQFDASSSYPNDSNVKYRPAQVRWDFGDGVQEMVEVKPAWSWFSGSSMRVRHQYAAAGTYTVTLTLTDTLGYSDNAVRTITVGAPGGDDDEVEVVEDDFVVGTVTWEPGDEEEDEGDCIFINGTVLNNAPVAAGVQLTATATNATGAVVGTFTYWPAGANNIGAGVNYAYGFFLCDLTIPGTQVVTVEVVVSDVAIY